MEPIIYHQGNRSQAIPLVKCFYDQMTLSIELNKVCKERQIIDDYLFDVINSTSKEKKKKFALCGGISRVDDPKEFYGKFTDLLTGWVDPTTEELILIFMFEYFNTSSSIGILETILSIKDKLPNSHILWLSEDDDFLSAGDKLKQMSKHLLFYVEEINFTFE